MEISCVGAVLMLSARVGSLRAQFSMEGGRLHGTPDHALAVAVGDDPLRCPGRDVAGLLVLDLLAEAEHPLLALMHRDMLALVLIVAAVADLGALILLCLPHKLTHRDFASASLRAALGMHVLRDGEPVGQLDVPVAAERRRHGRVAAVHVWVVAGAPQDPDHAPLAAAGHALVLGDARADQQRLLCEPGLARKARLALARVLGVSAVLKRPAHPAGVWYMDVVLLVHLELLHVHGQILALPGFGAHVSAALIFWAAQHERGVSVLGPSILHSFSLLLPGLRVAVEGSADVARVI